MMGAKVFGCAVAWAAAAGCAWACTGLYAGRLTTVNGRALVGRTVDLGKTTATMRTVVTPRVENAPGRFWTGVDGFRRALPATTRKMVSTPRATADGRGRFDSCVLNEDGLAISATVTGVTRAEAKAADPFVPTGAREESLPGYLGLTCATAREAVEHAGRVIAEQGNAEPNVYFFADPKETWYLETYTGHEWAAVRMPDDKVAFFGNHFCLGGVDPRSDGVLHSPGLYARAEREGLVVMDAETGFPDLAATYGDGLKRTANANLRSWWGRHLWANESSSAYGPERRYPQFFAPARKLTVRDFLEAMRSRYEGERWCPEETGCTAERLVGTELTATAHVIEMRSDLPKAFAATAWVALANPEHSVFLPIWAGVTSVPADYSLDRDDPNAPKGSLAAENDAEAPDEGKIAFDKRLAGARFRRLCALAELDRRQHGDGVRAFWRAREDELLARTDALLAEVAGNPALAAARLTAFAAGERTRALADADRLFDDLMAYVVLYNSTNPPKNFRMPFLRKARVVAFGDSIAEGVIGIRPEENWLKLLGRLLGNGYELFNAGVGGNSAREAMARFDRDVLARRPDLVILEFGGNNDCRRSPERVVDDTEFKAHLEAFRRRLPSGCRVIAVTFPPIVDEWHGMTRLPEAAAWWPRGLDRAHDSQREIVRAFAKESGWTLVDLHAILKPQIRACALPDGVHLNPKGQRVFADAVFKAMIGKPTAAMKRAAEELDREADWTAALREPVLSNGAGNSTWQYVFTEVAEKDAAADRAWRRLKTRAEYDAHCAKMREAFLEGIGGLPAERSPLNARVTGTVRREGYRVEKVLFESYPGVHVTANLFVPDGASAADPRPAVVVTCGHSSDGKAYAGYQRGCVQLAKAGFVALIYDPFNQGERGPQSTVMGHTSIGVKASLLGWSMARLRIWDGMRAIDYVQSRPEVRKDAIGYTGQSGGGTMSALMTAIDGRVRAGAPSCYLTSLREVCEHIGPQDAEQNLFGQLSRGLNHAGYVLMRGVPVQMNVCRGDFFPYSGSVETFGTVQDVAATLGAEERYSLFDVPGGHGWREAARTSMVAWMRRWVAGDRSVKFEPEAWRALDVDFDPAKNDMGLSEKECFAAPEGDVKNLPGERSAYDLLREELAAVERTRPRLDAAGLAAAAKRLAGIRTPKESGVFVRTLGVSVRAGGVKAERLAFAYPNGFAVPAVLLAPPAAKGAPVVVAASAGRGACGKLAAEFLDAGRPVLAADVSGAGEISGLPITSYYGSRFKEEPAAVMLYLLGESMVGRRAGEMLALADYAKARFGAAPLLVTSGVTAPVAAAHAFAAGRDVIAGVRIEGDAPLSWTEVVRGSNRHKDGAVGFPFASCVTGALRAYDWPDLLK